MNQQTNVVSIHPYFKAKPGKLAEAKAMLPKFVTQTTGESRMLHYDFTINGDEIFCRELYVGAEGLQAHVENVGPVLAEFLKIVDLVRLEIHGPAAELEKLKGPLADLKPSWYVYECGAQK